MKLDAVQTRYEDVTIYPAYVPHRISVALADIPALLEAVKAADALWTTLRNIEGDPFPEKLIDAMVAYESARGLHDAEGDD